MFFHQKNKLKFISCH